MIPKDPEREERISMQIVVDAYNEIDRAMGWYYYLEDWMNIPFPALWRNDKVEVIGMASEEECETEMIVEIRYRDGDEEDIIPIRLQDIQLLDEVDEPTKRAVEDWHYWIDRGYEF